MAKFQKFLKEMTEDEFEKKADAAEKAFLKTGLPLLMEMAKYYGFEGTMDFLQDYIRDVEPISPDAE